MIALHDGNQGGKACMRWRALAAVEGRTRRPPSAPIVSITVVLCPLTGTDHRLFWMRSAWWCHDCRQKIESCCEGGGCPSIAEVALPERDDAASGAAHR